MNFQLLLCFILLKAKDLFGCHNCKILLYFQHKVSKVLWLGFLLSFLVPIAVLNSKTCMSVYSSVYIHYRNYTETNPNIITLP